MIFQRVTTILLITDRNLETKAENQSKGIL